MNRILFLSPLILLLSSMTVAQQGAPGDSARIVILSDRVGSVISEDERGKYHVLTQFEGFREAVVLQFPDSSYAVRVTLVSAGELRDTVVRYSGATIMMMAEKIEHIEEMESGNYVLGSHPPTLTYDLGGVSVPRALVPRTVPGPSGSERSRRESRPQGAGGSRSSRFVLPSPYGAEPLPLARVSGLHMPRYYPSFAIAFGMRTIAPDLSGLAPATGVAPRMDISPVFDIVPEFLITEEIGLQADAGISPGDKCHTASLAIVLYAHPFGDPGLRPFLEGGYLWTSMGGSASGLDFSAGGGGFRLGGGIEFQLGSVVGIALDVCYVWIGRKPTVFTDWVDGAEVGTPVSVDLSTLQFGIRIKFQ
jgi:hypothetical protein